MEVDEIVHTFGDVHIYSNHLEQVELQLTREPKPLPIMKMNSARVLVHIFVEKHKVVKYFLQKKPIIDLLAPYGQKVGHGALNPYGA